MAKDATSILHEDEQCSKLSQKEGSPCILLLLDFLQNFSPTHRAQNTFDSARSSKLDPLAVIGGTFVDNCGLLILVHLKKSNLVRVELVLHYLEPKTAALSDSMFAERMKCCNQVIQRSFGL